MRIRSLTVLMPAAGCALLALAPIPGRALSIRSVRLTRVPGGGIQPQAAVDPQGTIHLLYSQGEPGAGDIFYVKREPKSEQFTTPIRVNSGPGSVIAAGTVRGAHLAIGRRGRVHVAWMGSKAAEPRGPSGAHPMLYTRLADDGREFEPQRNLMQFAAGLDGGASVAADGAGNVYVAWHAGLGRGEAARRMWVARSSDDGATFAREEAVDDGTGACGCCGMRAASDARGAVSILYRSAVEEVHRDIYLLRSEKPGAPFRSMRLDPWEIKACPMSTAAIASSRAATVLGWETAGQVYLGSLDTGSDAAARRVPAPGEGGGRKHPSVAVNDRGEALLAWTEGTGWNRGGSLAWQLFDGSGKPIGETGRAAGIAVWSLAAAIAHRDGSFEIVY